jgi:PleD family two-component response regulator
MTNRRLLLIEDDYDVAEMLLMYFHSHDYDVIHADMGMAGIELARTKFPTLILLDVMLPDMDGYDVCVRLRQTVMTKYIPILFLTQRDERASKVRGLELGADDYITKPFDVDELRLRVQASIRRATGDSLHEPRTGLPTGVMVEDEFSRKSRTKDAFTGLIYTIEGFAAYRDVYGFVAANEVISHAGKTIQALLGELGTANDFVGIVEDDFIVLTHSYDVYRLDQAIKDRFVQEVRAFYSFVDADRGSLLINAGQHDEMAAPLMHFVSEQRSVVHSQD